MNDVLSSGLRVAAVLATACFLGSCSEPVDPQPGGSPAKDAPAARAEKDGPETAAERAPTGGDVVPGTGTPGGTGPRNLTPDEQAQVVDRMLQEQARRQAEGLGGGRVEVNGAWNYTGYSYLSPNPDAAVEARLVAVDITVSGHTPHFDLDDIEIVDSRSFVSYGSDPHVEFLTLGGELMAPGQAPAAPPRASRYLLIYAYPKDTDEFRLFYWGRQLTAAPFPIAEGGWEVPYPEPEE